MRKIKQMADYFRYPMWETTSGEYGDISPESLPISDDLRKAIIVWASTYDVILDMNNPSEAGFKTQEDVNQFRSAGYSLTDRLQKELEPKYIVTHNIVVGDIKA
jgi:hypothetical protein